MSAKMGSFSEEELLEILGVTKCFFEYLPEDKDEINREISSLLVRGGHSKHLHKQEMTPTEILQGEDFFEFNSIKPLKHI